MDDVFYENERRLLHLCLAGSRLWSTYLKRFKNSVVGEPEINLLRAYVKNQSEAQNRKSVDVVQDIITRFKIKEMKDMNLVQFEMLMEESKK